MSRKTDPGTKPYYFIDVDLTSRQIVGYRTERRDTVEVKLTDGYHRVFLSTGQYNKFVKELKDYES